jgi:hypothetical protein
MNKLMEEYQNKPKDKFYIQIHHWTNMLVPSGVGHIQLCPGRSAIVCLSRKPLDYAYSKYDKNETLEDNEDGLNRPTRIGKHFIPLGKQFDKQLNKDKDVGYASEFNIQEGVTEALPVLYLNQQDINFGDRVKEIFQNHIAEDSNSMVYIYKPFVIRLQNTNFYFLITDKRSKDMFDPEHLPEDQTKPLEEVFKRELDILKEYIGLDFCQRLEDTEFILVQ